MNPREEWNLDTFHLGRRVLVFDRLDSTSTYAASLAHDPNHDGLVVVADEQTAGRGQHGRSWLCQPGAGVLLSVVLFPPSELRRPPLLTAWAAVSVCETIVESTGLEPSIKWPNDVLIGGRKVCGSLIEQGRGVVIGVGLNVHQSAETLASARLPQAGSLALFTNRQLERTQITRQLIRQMDQEYQRLCRGEHLGLQAKWNQRLGLVGKNVVADCSSGCVRGRLSELSWEGVVLELNTGASVRLQPEAIRHLEQG